MYQMKKLLTAVCLAATFSAPAQTLFTYGKDKVSATDFLEAFQKNNQGPVTEKVLKNYLDLYIASRLKIREAKAKGYDTLPQLLADLANLRQQILPTYLNDKESMNRMIDLQMQQAPQIQGARPQVEKFFNKYLSWNALKDDYVKKTIIDQECSVRVR